ncbi:DUF1284 domain-containing protein [uncultured Methanobrevibacter sp.]|uniref:DUF1284 domain-containing protein n=1 Tax=uncultured Methanobrevibacter sp. TaxID=253161 RepID=UPI00261BD1C7|nr:DUF1284 domain-containing protein [uncultured Methanobrevibacter sp.]
MKLILRGHHLLCLQGFQGYGYSDNFIKNMNYINNLRKSKNTIISITNKADDICKCCPNLKNNLCENEKQNAKITKMDNEIISKLDTSKKYDAQELFNKITTIFNSKESVKYICGSCGWHEKCLFYKKLK